jgi:hypothetical protein
MKEQGRYAEVRTSGLRENAISKSSEYGPVKNAFAAAEIAAIGEKNSHAAKDLHLRLDTGIAEPAPRTEEA